MKPTKDKTGPYISEPIFLTYAQRLSTLTESPKSHSKLVVVIKSLGKVERLTKAVHDNHEMASRECNIHGIFAEQLVDGLNQQKLQNTLHDNM